MIELLIGDIASGKSTYSANKALNGFIIVNDDAIVTALHGGNYTLYDKNLKMLYKAVEMSIITYTLSMGKCLLIDRPNQSIESRARYISIARSLECPIKAICFPQENVRLHAKRRFDSDNRGYDYQYWLNVVEHHRNKYEEPTLEEGFSKIVKLEKDWYENIIRQSL